MRFPGFEGEWEVRKLGEIAEIARGKSKHRPRDADFLFGGQYPFIQTGDIKKADLYLTEYNQTYSEQGLSQSKLWDEDTLCITIAANIAETAILKIKACFPDSIIGLLPHKDRATVLFVKYSFDKFKIFIQRLSQGIAQDNLNQEKLSNVKFNFPSIEEQTKIASFLSLLDERISTQNKIIEQLETLIKGLSEKLFSQKIRFKNFMTQWEFKNLGEICIYKNGGSFEKEIVEEGIYNLITLNSIDIDGNLKKVHKKVNKTDYSLRKGDLVIVLSDVAHGNFLGLTDIIPNDSFVLNQRMGALKPKIDVNRFFLKSIININQKYFKLKGQGSSQLNLSKGDIENFEVLFPSIEEQNAIAQFLFCITNKIQTERNLLDKYQSQKQYLLQNLFI
ncbi:restriction endonuclease subunit S [Chryseobacterium culicis]|uniref:restriction endonuclease subunit S n=1 Tax=Chryseobacterium culicis TaxID=680127 RepID=UPI0028A040C1|nr:restriction endonuclease subunit S [Chryseobacterium culicis]